jgi:hypothetical protein
MRITQFQTNFSVGEIDPLVRSRTDIEQYNNALEEATNVLVQPQGGITRRDGLKYIATIAQGTVYSKYKLIPFEFNVSDSYILVLTSYNTTGRIFVFKNGVQLTVNGANFITCAGITPTMVDEINYTQAVETLILCHEDLETKRLVRNSDTSWTYENVPFTNIPKYAFNFDTHNPNFSITPSATEGNITITASSVSTETGQAQGGTANTITVKSSSSYADNYPNGMFITLTSGTGSGQSKHVKSFVASSKVLTVFTNWTTAPDNTTHYKIEAFAPAAVGEYASVLTTFGRARYVEFVSATEMKAVVETPFFDASAVVAGNWESEHGYEDTWSNTRGWPRSSCFHEGRLYFGGSKTRSNTVWGSRTIDYFNFEPGTGLADESVEATINTNQLNAIVNVVSASNLRIFSTGGEFIIQQTDNAAITPSNFLVRPQTQLGSKPGLPIENLNGASVFIQRQGKTLNAFQYTDSTASYQVQSLSVLSSHLLKTPIDIASVRATSTDEADKIYIVNGDDGSLAVYSILIGQNVIAPSRFTTTGTFIAVGVDVSDVYVMVKREVSGQAIQWNLEKFDSTYLLDSAEKGEGSFPDTTSGQLTQLIGFTVNIVRDGLVDPTQVVPANSIITFASQATASWEVGLDFTVSAKTMPAEPTLQSGSTQGVQKRILQVDALVHDTQDLKINNQQIAFRSLGQSLDTPISEFTGTKTAHALLGYTKSGQITITQSVPLKMNVLGLEYKMSVGN